MKPLTRKVKGDGHKPQMDNLFLSSDLSNDLTKLKTDYWSRVIPNIKWTPWKLPPQNKKLNQGDIHSMARGDLTTMVWRGRNLYILTNMHNASTNDNFCVEHGNVMKQRAIRNFNIILCSHYHMVFYPTPFILTPGLVMVPDISEGILACSLH